MKRWIFNLVTSISMLLFVATVAMWVRSYWVRCDGCNLLPHTPEYNIGFERRGSLIALTIYYPSSYLPPISAGMIDTPGDPETGWITYAYFCGHQIVGGIGYVRTAVGIALLMPLWMMMLIFAIPPIMWLNWLCRRMTRPKAKGGAFPVELEKPKVNP